MASVALSSSSYSNTTTTLCADDSFATYLSLISQSFSADLALSCPTSTNNPNSRRSSSLSFTQKRTDDGELDVFTAEKYFSGTLDTTDTLLDYPNIITKIPDNKMMMKSPRPAHTCSETTTSTNSRTVLLRGGPHHLQEHQHRQHQKNQESRCGCGARRSFLDVFRCVRPKKNDVEVEDDDNAEINNTRKWRRSESSSELFEIESLSTGSVLPVGGYNINAYAPSEVSIEWSVVTASAANLSTTTSAAASGRRVGRNGSEHGMSTKKRRSSASGILMMGCVSEKAVSVVREEGKVVGSLERYRAMMDLESAMDVAGAAAVAARPRRASLG